MAVDRGNVSSQRLTLSDGSVVWVDTVPGDVEEEVAFRRGTTPFSAVMPSVVTLCQDLGSALKAAAPHRAQVQFGVAFKAESTGLSALVAKAGVEANFLITLEWSRDGRPESDLLSGPDAAPDSDAG